MYTVSAAHPCARHSAKVSAGFHINKNSPAVGSILTRRVFKSQLIQCCRRTGLKVQGGEGILCIRAS